MNKFYIIKHLSTCILMIHFFFLFSTCTFTVIDIGKRKHTKAMTLYIKENKSCFWRSIYAVWHFDHSCWF